MTKYRSPYTGTKYLVRILIFDDGPTEEHLHVSQRPEWVCNTDFVLCFTIIFFYKKYCKMHMLRSNVFDI
jgi:hypothetical protein